MQDMIKLCRVCANKGANLKKESEDLKMNQLEMMYLVTMLKLNNIPFDLILQPHYYTLQVIYPSKLNCKFDVVCNTLSMGNESGLLEILNHNTNETTGYLKGCDAYNLIYKYHMAHN